MLVDVTKPISSLGGETLQDVDAQGNAVDATYRVAMVNALLSPVQKETGVEKIKKYELAKKIYASDEVDLNEEEITLIKERVGAVYPPIVIGRINDLLKV